MTNTMAFSQEAAELIKDALGYYINDKIIREKDYTDVSDKFELAASLYETFSEMYQ